MTEPLGFRLKSAREASGVALRDIAAKTKISVSALEALERNDFSRLPGGIFSRAFVRSYAIAIGLDPETTVQEFLDEIKHSESEAARVASARPEVTPEDRAFLERQKRAIRLLQIAGVLVVVAAGTGAALAYLKWKKSAAPDTPTAAVAPTSPAAPASSTANPPVPQSPPASPASAPGSNPPPSTGTAASSAAGSSPPRTPTPAPPPAASPATGQAPPATVVPPEAPPPVPVPPAPVEPLTIEFEVTSACFVEIASDGRVSFSKAMEPGERQRIQAQKEVRLKVGDAGAFVWSVNGKRARSLGAAGSARQATVTQANFKRFQR
ncbi:MAG: RodZ domain-containing protein [Acidobacteriota bacterium]